MNDFSNRKVAFYIRVSTERQAKVKEGSLKNQKQMLLAELEKRNSYTNNWGKLIDVYVDEGISGKDINRPAFQKMLNDIRMGKIDTVMFTELSRLSRSLKDFLNIFEFMQKFNCDLICLKTDIDTTTPYKNLITKIFMLFGEFEREMTSQRTSINAYERSKRGLANGGFVPLGYKRDKAKKGYFLIDEKEALIVKDIFNTYLKEKSIKKTLDIIKNKYSNIKFNRSKIYSILTNKAYLGIREIYKKDKSRYEEVKAVWESILDKDIFNQVSKLLQANKDKYHSRGDKKFNYFLSGLLVCEKCGERLQGKSAYSSNKKRHFYYSHKGVCKHDGLNRIDAQAVHNLILEWFKDISNNGEKFNRLKEEGRERINNRIKYLENSIKILQKESLELEKEIEARVDEMMKSKSDIIKQAIEKSIIKLDEGINLNEEKINYARYEIKELKNLLSDDKDLFQEYRQRIKDILNQGTENIKEKIKELVSFIRLGDKEIKIALSSVNRKGLVSMLFASAPRDGLEPPT